MQPKRFKRFKQAHNDFNNNYFRVHHDDYLNIHTNVLNRDKQYKLHMEQL